MRGYQLKFYTHENTQHRGHLLYDWLINKAKEMGFHGGSVFKTMAGFGRCGIIHEEHFFELPANCGVEVLFVLNEEETDRFLKALKAEKLNVFFVKVPVEYGTLP